MPFSMRNVSPKLSPTSWCASLTVQPSRFLPLKIGTQSSRLAAELCAAAGSTARHKRATFFSMAFSITLRILYDLSEDLTAALLTAPRAGILPAIENHPRGVASHSGNRKVGHCDNRSIAGPLDVDRDRNRYITAVVHHARAHQPGVAGQLGDAFDDVLLFADDLVVMQP